MKPVRCPKGDMTSDVRPSPNPACVTKSSIGACIEACECITPFDSPVVPEVKARTARSSLGDDRSDPSGSSLGTPQDISLETTPLRRRSSPTQMTCSQIGQFVGQLHDHRRVVEASVDRRDHDNLALGALEDEGQLTLPVDRGDRADDGAQPGGGVGVDDRFGPVRQQQAEHVTLAKAQGGEVGADRHDVGHAARP